MCHLHAVIHNPKNNAILLVDVNTPKARKISLERFRLSLALVPVAVNILNEAVDFFQRLLILRLPIEIICPRRILPNLIHQSTSISSCFVRLRPALTSAIAARRRAIFSSL